MPAEANFTVSDSSPDGATYDFIVCGGGTSGCVVARRLAENPSVRVLLLEAGGDERVPSVTDSRVWMSNIGSDRDWQFRAEPSGSLNGRTPPLPMGKVLGGGSSVNGLIWARGHKNDFDSWAEEAGDPSWRYEAILDLYKRAEDWDGPANPRLRGQDGPVYITLPKDPVPVAHALVEATAAAGIPAAADLNAETMESDGGCGIPNVTVRDGNVRVSMASAYLRPVMDQPNLTVLLGARVERVRLDGLRAVGVDYVHDGSQQTAFASAEIVLSAGAIHTPKILMLSGIGDERMLKAHGIPVVHHLPGIGQNFQDHILVAGCVWEYRFPEPPRNNSAEFTFFAKSDPSLKTPDLQPVLEECAFGSEITGPRFGLPTERSAAWTLAPGLVQPTSRGHLALTGNRASDPVAVHANFLSMPEDMKALVRCIELCREIGNAPALREFVKRELMPGPLRGAEMENFLRDAAGTYFHQTCTAKMGRGAMAVVDGSLKVHGIEGLRIADGSIMPTITTGNTMAPCVLIGEKAADILREAHGIRT